MIIKGFLLLLLSFISVTQCYTSEDCNHLDLDENDLKSLEYFEICGRNRVYDDECPNSTNCSCCLTSNRNKDTYLKFNEIYSNSTRRSLVKEKITSIIGSPHKNRLVTVMVLNKGYIAFFLNWLCSLDKHGIIMKSEDLLLFVDRESSIIFSQLKLPYKYLILEDDWYLDNYIISNATGEYNNRVQKNGLPDPIELLTKLKVFVQNDLIELGHDYLMNDIDIAWKADPRVWLLKSHQRKGMRFDIEMSYDGRRDKTGPGNSGFMVVYNNCRTKFLYNVMFRHKQLLWQYYTGYQLWMSAWLVRSKLSFYIRSRLLPSAQFVNGHMLYQVEDDFHYHKNEEKGLFHTFYLDPKYDPADMLIAHASWTRSFKPKIGKLKAVGLWYYEPDLCPAYYSREVDPRRDLSHAYFRYNNSVYTHNNYSLTSPTSP